MDLDEETPEIYTTARCRLCGAEESALVLHVAKQVWEGLPAYSRDAANTRFFVSGGYALLHHVCTSMQGDMRWWDWERHWWACKQPERGTDADTRFDLSCAECAVRWAQTLLPDPN